MEMNLDDFDYKLPKGLIAHEPVDPRDSSRLLVVDRKTKSWDHLIFKDLGGWLNKTDVLVLNQSKVFPARLYGKKESGGKCEILLLRQLENEKWEAISRPGLEVGKKVFFDKQIKGEIVDKELDSGILVLKFNQSREVVWEFIDNHGWVPIPPYIKRQGNDQLLKDQYQTIFASQLGSVAAPTAGLHFTKNLLQKLKGQGVQVEYVTLHVGLGTFQKLRLADLQSKVLHKEVYEINRGVAERLNQAKRAGKRIIAVGTTSTRVLESNVAMEGGGKLVDGRFETNLFIYPEYKFNFVDSLITNFHLPKSSLLMLVSAFTSIPNSDEKWFDFKSSFIGKGYQEAIKNNYRFYSFGDAMWIK